LVKIKCASNVEQTSTRAERFSQKRTLAQEITQDLAKTNKTAKKIIVHNRNFIDDQTTVLFFFPFC